MPERCGARYLCCALIPREIDTPEKLQRFSDKLCKIAEKVQAAGLIFTFHPIAPDLRNMDGQPVFERLMELLPRDVQLTFCINAAFGAGVDPLPIFAKYAGRVDLVHFKDDAPMPDGGRHLMPLGQGTHDWAPILQVCNQVGVKYIFAEQERWLKDAFDCAKDSFEYLVRLGLRNQMITERMMHVTFLGYQASSLKTYLTTPNNLSDTFRKLRDIGYRHLQLQWIDPAVPLEYTAEALRETGLTCIATQAGFKEVRDNLDYYVNMNRLWGSNCLCISTIPREQMTREGLVNFAAEMGRILQILGEQGISLTFHPIAFNFEPVNNVNAVDTVMELFPQEIGLTLCILQAVRAGLNPVTLLERYSGRIEICHFKDSAVFPDGKEYLVPVGQGQIDWLPIFDACHRTGVKWGLAEQESWRKDAFVCARESFDYISGCGITCP